MPNSPQPAARSGLFPTELSIADFLAIARRRWKWIFFLVLVGIGAATAYFKTTPPTYESQAQVLVMRKDPRLATTTGVQGESDAKISEDLLATHVQLVQSHRVVNDALTKNSLDTLPSITERLKEGDSAAKYVIENLLVTRGGVAQAKNAHVLNIAFRHRSELDSQRILQAIIDHYQQFLAEKFQDVNSEAADLIA